MEKHECDECGDEIKTKTYNRYRLGSRVIIGYVGKVQRFVMEKSEDEFSNHQFASNLAIDLEFEICSKKCLLNYLRRNLK